jgi:ribokinase
MEADDVSAAKELGEAQMDRSQGALGVHLPSPTRVRDLAREPGDQLGVATADPPQPDDPECGPAQLEPEVRARVSGPAAGAKVRFGMTHPSRRVGAGIKPIQCRERLPSPMHVAVVGHVEWIEFARVEHVPAPGEIVNALEVWEEPAGGGAVAAVQLARLAGACLFLTVLGDDALGHRAKRELEALGVRVQAAWRSEPQRRAFVHLDGDAERTITVMGSRLGPHEADSLPWSELHGVDAVYFTAGDAAAVQAARAARKLVATVRAIDPLAKARVQLDALVSSAKDESERYEPGQIDPPPLLVARTAGDAGGSLVTADGKESHWAAAPLPAPKVDAYGAGDSFAAGLTYGLGDGRSPQEALALGAACGAACMTGRGPYEGQLRTAN